MFRRISDRVTNLKIQISLQIIQIVWVNWTGSPTDSSDSSSYDNNCLGEVVTGSPSDKPDSPVKNGPILALDYDCNGAK